MVPQPVLNASGGIHPDEKTSRRWMHWGDLRRSCSPSWSRTFHLSPCGSLFGITWGTRKDILNKYYYIENSYTWCIIRTCWIAFELPQQIHIHFHPLPPPSFQRPCPAPTPRTPRTKRWAAARLPRARAPRWRRRRRWNCHRPWGPAVPGSGSEARFKKGCRRPRNNSKCNMFWTQFFFDNMLNTFWPILWGFLWLIAFCSKATLVGLQVQ